MNSDKKTTGELQLDVILFINWYYRKDLVLYM